MIEGTSVKNLTARVLHAGHPKNSLVPMVLAHGVLGPMTFHYVRMGEIVGQVAGQYQPDKLDALLDEVAESISLFACPTPQMLYETWKMDDWLLERLGMVQ